MFGGGRRQPVIVPRRQGGPVNLVIAALIVAGVGYATGGKMPGIHPAGGAAKAQTAVAAGGYVNPLAGQTWTRDRIDQGFDLLPGRCRDAQHCTGAAPTPVRAIGKGRVIYADTSSGWPGGVFMAYRLSSGPMKGGVIFVAEHLTNVAPAGTRITRPGQVIATALPGFPFTEWGWATCDGSAPAVGYGSAADGTSMPGGSAFARFMRGLGAWPAPDTGAENPGPGRKLYRCT
jgi:hypothetical protein